MAVLRTLLGDALRTTRLRQERTLREVSAAARVSLGYLSEVERGQKEASSELLASICSALGVRLSELLRDVSEVLAVVESETRPVLLPVSMPEAGSSAGSRRVERPVAAVGAVPTAVAATPVHDIVAA